MASILRIALIAILAVQISSCKDNSKDKNLIKLLENKLEQSNKTIHLHTEVILRSLEEKSTDPMTKEKAIIWFPKAKSIDSFSTSLYNHLQHLKEKARINSEEIKYLVTKLKTYSNQILGVDERIRQEFEHNQFLSSCASDSLQIQSKKTQTDFIEGLNPESQKAMLTNIQNDIRVVENKTVTYCHEQINYHTPIYDMFYSALISQTVSAVFPGDKIEIMAGIGFYSTMNNPKIVIDRKSVPVGEAGFALYKLNASSKPGKYKVPVKINYTDQDGKDVRLERILEYTVLPPCN